MAAGAAWMFGNVHFLALICDEETLVERLRSRPAWRGCTDEYIQRQVEYQRWLKAKCDTAFDPPLTFIDTTNEPVQVTSERIREWVMSKA